MKKLKNEIFQNISKILTEKKDVWLEENNIQFEDVLNKFIKFTNNPESFIEISKFTPPIITQKAITETMEIKDKNEKNMKNIQVTKDFSLKIHEKDVNQIARDNSGMEVYFKGKKYSGSKFEIDLAKDLLKEKIPEDQKENYKNQTTNIVRYGCAQTLGHRIYYEILLKHLKNLIPKENTRTNSISIKVKDNNIILKYKMNMILYSAVNCIVDEKTKYSAEFEATWNLGSENISIKTTSFYKL